MISKESKIFIAGHKGMVGNSLVNLCKKRNYNNIITISKNKLDLLDQKKTHNFIQKIKPDAVIIAAAKVGGINANNTFKADFLYQNLQIQNNLIHGSYLAGVKKLIFLGSSCIYPRDCKQPIKESYLLNSELEKTNEPYAIAKIAGLKLCESYNYQYKTNYLTLMPCNLYGENDNYDSLNSHFLPALIKKIHNAIIKKETTIEIWGNGRAKRELMHVDDLSDAILYFLTKKTNHSLINIGSNHEDTIKNFALKVMKILNYKLNIKFNLKKPNGTPRKLLDISLASKYGWHSKISFEVGLTKTYEDFIKRAIV